MLLFVIVILLMIGAFWLITREYPVDGKTDYYIIKNGAMRYTGVLGICMSIPWFFAIAKSIILLILDLFSDKTEEFNVKIGSDVEIHLPYHSFYVVDTFKSRFKNVVSIFLPWYYVFSHSYFLLNMDINNIGNLRQKQNVQVVATKYSHVIIRVSNKKHTQ